MTKEDYKKLVLIPRVNKLISLSSNARSSKYYDCKDSYKIRNRVDKLLHQMGNTLNSLQG